MNSNGIHIRNLRLEIGALYMVPSPGATSWEHAIVYFSHTEKKKSGQGTRAVWEKKSGFSAQKVRARNPYPE